MSFILWLWLLAVGLATIVLFGATKWRRFTQVGSELAAALLLVSLPLVFLLPFATWVVVTAAVIHIWMLVLPARLYMGRLEQPFLFKSTRVNALAGFIMADILCALAIWYPAEWAEVTLVTLLSIALLIGGVFFCQLLWNMRHYRLRGADQPQAKVPTVSICIPARNEDHALTECLTSVLASDYPKLEVLVLDDCSQDKTSAIIRSFAHEGVRFVQGDQPAIGWLGKTQAMQTLVDHASGELIVFMDVDTHVAPDSISQLVRYTQAHNLQMVSVAPQNRLGVTPATLFGTLEYFWRIALPITKKRLPVSSRLWLITRGSLDSLGGFASVSRKIVPEESFARRLFSGNAYRFLVSSRSLGVTTAKRWHSQAATALRLSYPLLRRQPIVVLLVSAAVLSVFFGPLAVVVAGIMQQSLTPAFWLAAAVVGLLAIDYYLVIGRTQPKTWLLSGLLLPYVIVQEIAIYYASLLAYEFSEVNWKGRNVCYPVLVTQPQRPRWHQ